VALQEMIDMDEIAKFNAERGAILLKGDLDDVLAFVLRQEPDYVPMNRHVLEIMLHKSRTAVASLPMEVRAASRSWLIERGYQPYDDGDVG
jgi:hypothetical protein